ncbi:MAG: hypothetical protein HJJLKODD_00891 [Phycisphaerae bacterium]|nr:hypothetical protein [Phycisphaerae bacterium]
MRLHRSKSHWCSRGFTIVELLLVIGIIMTLLAILLPALIAARAAAKSMVCVASLRGQVQDFNYLVMQDGDIEKLRRWNQEYELLSTFGLSSFIDRQYQAGVYIPGIVNPWDPGDPQNPPSSTVPRILNTRSRLVCPENWKKPLLVKPGGPVTTGNILTPDNDLYVYPLKNLSYGWNGTLDRVPRLNDAGAWETKYVKLSDEIGNWSNATRLPLLMDVDVDPAKFYVAGTVTPHLIAPADEPGVLKPGNLYSTPPGYTNRGDQYYWGRQWFPANRHPNRKNNIALLDGCVESYDEIGLLTNPSISWQDFIPEDQLSTQPHGG